MIVHALLYGQPLCGFSTGVPRDWPPDHKWTQVSDLGNINCPGCKDEAEKHLKNQSTTTSAIGEKGIVQDGDTSDGEAGGILRL